MATQKDVAKLAGVSVSTVSRVMNDSSLVDEKTRADVKNAIKKLNYKPNLVAYGLRAKSSRLIGLILPELVHQAYAGIAQYVEAYCEEKVYSTLIGLHRNDREREKQLIDEFQRRNVDGLILQPVVDEQSVSANLLEYTTVPMVLYGHSYTSAQMSSVQFNNYRAGEMAAQHFVELGHKRIACTVGPMGMRYLRDRLYGFRDELARHKLEVRQLDIFECDFNYQVPGRISGRDAVHAFVDGRRSEEIPTAIWGHNDLVAIGIIKELQRRKIRVPEEISVIGMDNLALTDMIYPPLTTIGQPLEKMAMRSVDMVVQAIEQKEDCVPETIRMEPELIIRESTARYMS